MERVRQRRDRWEVDERSEGREDRRKACEQDNRPFLVYCEHGVRGRWHPVFRSSIILGHMSLSFVRILFFRADCVDSAVRFMDQQRTAGHFFWSVSLGGIFGRHGVFESARSSIYADLQSFCGAVSRGPNVDQTGHVSHVIHRLSSFSLDIVWSLI